MKKADLRVGFFRVVCLKEDYYLDVLFNYLNKIIHLNKFALRAQGCAFIPAIPWITYWRRCGSSWGLSASACSAGIDSLSRN